MASEEAATADWENTKENFVPLKQGRTAAALAATPLSAAKKGGGELEAQKRSLLAAIEATADDPLPAWLKYIRWTQEQCCLQGGKAELRGVLEAATKALTATGRYHDDVRLLRIWVQYADCLADPADVFLYLEDQGIGRQHALLYEAYATFLELRGGFAQAALVLQEGLDRLAAPVERLRQKQAAFQQRMAKRMQRQASEAALGMAPADDAGASRASLAPLVPLDGAAAPVQLDENGRPLAAQHARGMQRRPQQLSSALSAALGVQPAPAAALGGARGAGSGARPAGSLWGLPAGGAQQQQQQQQQQGALRGLLGIPGVTNPTRPAAGSSSNAAPRLLDVHVDDEFGPGGRGPVPTAFPPALQQHAALPGLAAASKENSSEPGAWAGQRLQQQAALSGPVGARLEVYEDEDSEEAADGDPAAAAAAAVAAAADAARAAQQQQQGGLRRQLDAAPAAAAAAAAAPPAAARQPFGAAAPPAAASSSGPTPHGYDESLLTGPGGEEMTFEEHRAAAWTARNAAQQQQQQQAPPQQQQQQAQPAPHAPSLPLQAAAPVAEPTVTINTRAALEAMNGMFGGGSDDTTAMHAFSRAAARRRSMGLGGGAAAAAAAAGADGGGVTINTRAALEAMNGMFGGGDDTTTMHGFGRAASGSSGGSSGGGVRGAAALQEPTVTINTRAALDYMNGVFGDATATMTGAGVAAACARGGGNRAARSSRGSRLSMLPPSGSGAGGLLGVYEDTELLTPAAVAQAAAGGMLGVYEDTEFVGSKLAAAAAAAGGGGSGGSGAAAPGSTAGHTGGLELYEDTEFITRPMGSGSSSVGRGSLGPAGGGGAAAGSSGLEFYEDTEFITRAVGSSSSSAAMAAAAAGAPGSSAGGPLELYEDTEFITTRPMGGGSSSGAMMSRANRLSLANEALSRGLAHSSSRGSENDLGSGGGGLQLYEDTEFITQPTTGAGSSGRPASACSSDAAEESGAGAAAAPGDENAGSRWRQQQQAVGQGSENAPPPVMQERQQLHLALPPQPYGRAGPSRLGPGSVPNSPGPSHPGTAASTPGRPPRTPGTPSAAGPWAQQLDSFHVLDSPAAAAALAARGQQHATAASSPAGGSLASSPGFGARENLPMCDAAAGGALKERLPARSMADRAARAAALQPLSSSRAQALGVQVDAAAAAAAGYEDNDAGGAAWARDDAVAHHQQQPQRLRASPGRALRSLHFGGSSGSGGQQHP